MKKDYFANIEYNRKKRRNSVVLSVILTFILLSTAVVFVVNKDYIFAVLFLLFMIVPIITIPLGFKNYPVHGNAIISIEKGLIISNGKAFDIKDINTVTVLIELPSSKIDKDDLKILEQLKTAMPEDEFFGAFDISYYDKNGKPQVEYAYIDHVIGALYHAVECGVKKYAIKFTIKKNTVTNECDLKKKLENDAKENALNKVSKKARNRQLI